MKSHLDVKGDILTVTINCDLTSTKVEDLRLWLMNQANPSSDTYARWTIFRLELAGAKMVDSVGLNLIISVLKAVQQRGASMQIVCPNPNVYRTLVFTRLDKHVELIKP